jgi:DNA-binding NarL/FixJ family response regulator
MSSTLRIAIVEDQALVRHGLRAVVESLGGLEVAVDAEDGDALLAALRGTKVDVILMDIRMPKRSGIEITRELRAQGDLTPVLLLTTFEDPSLLQRAVAAGAEGFLLKDAEPEELHAAIAEETQRIDMPHVLVAGMRLGIRPEVGPAHYLLQASFHHALP